MLKNYFKTILVCNIPDSISIIFNKRLLIFYINFYLIFIFTVMVI